MCVSDFCVFPTRSAYLYIFVGGFGFKIDWDVIIFAELNILFDYCSLLKRGENYVDFFLKKSDFC